MTEMKTENHHTGHGDIIEHGGEYGIEKLVKGITHAKKQDFFCVENPAVIDVFF